MERKPLSSLLDRKVLRLREPSPTVKAHEVAVRQNNLLLVNGYGTVVAQVSRAGLFDADGNFFQD